MVPSVPGAIGKLGGLPMPPGAMLENVHRHAARELQERFLPERGATGIIRSFKERRALCDEEPHGGGSCDSGRLDAAWET
jgi:hypothetical protein